MARLIQAGALARDQIDVYQSGIRVQGIDVSSLTLSLFTDNVLVPWTLIDGSKVPDASIVAGSVFFHEIPGAPGFYSVRFFPDRTGFWRLSVKYLPVEVIREYDALPASSAIFSPPIPSGLTPSFVK